MGLKTADINPLNVHNGGMRYNTVNKKYKNVDIMVNIENIPNHLLENFVDGFLLFLISDINIIPLNNVQIE